MHSQPAYYFYYYKQDDLEKQNEFFCLISNKQSLWKSNRDKIYVLFNSYWIDSAFKWKLRFFHFILFNAKWTFIYFFFVVLMFESAMGMQFLLDIIILKFQITRKGKVMEMIWIYSQLLLSWSSWTIRFVRGELWCW